jgi:hypothetical protein
MACQWLTLSIEMMPWPAGLAHRAGTPPCWLKGAWMSRPGAFGMKEFDGSTGLDL